MQKFLPRQKSADGRLLSRLLPAATSRNQGFPCPAARFTTAQLQLLQKRLRIARSMAPSVIVEVRVDVAPPSKEPFHRNRPVP
jgi:hypothetical protein